MDTQKRYRVTHWRVNLLVSLLMIAIIWIVGDIYYFLTTPLIVQKPNQPLVEYTLKPGSSITQLTHSLQQRGFLHRPLYFVALAKILGVTHRLKVGEYRFDAGATPIQVLKQIAAGRVFYRQITFLEGWTFAQMLATLQRYPFITHTLLHATPEQIMAKLGYPHEHPEGRFFPDTYRFTSGTPDYVVLRLAHREMAKHLKREWQLRSPNVSVYSTPYQALIAASLIEREAAVAEDRPKIAAVLIHRLTKNMPLQFDTTVLYGLDLPNHQALRKTHLHQETPYNTYLHKGLPPTPIGMPGLSSLRAALHPAPITALYFVAKGDGSQAHQFSDDLSKHHAAVQQYRKQLKRSAHAVEISEQGQCMPCHLSYPGYPHRKPWKWISHADTPRCWLPTWQQHYNVLCLITS